MALVVLPEGLQVSGSIGGTTWSRNRFGAYKRNRAVPVNPATDRQVLIRNYLQSLQLAWNDTLTQDQRDAWNEYGGNVTWKNRLGQDVHLPGPQHYIRSNIANLLAGGTRIDDAPVLFDVAAAELQLAVVASEAAGTLEITFDDALDWCDEDGAFQLIYMGRPVNPGKTFFGGPYRFCDVIAGDSGTPPTSPHTVAAGDVPWQYAEGQRIWVRTRILRADGRLSDFAQDSFLAVA